MSCAKTKLPNASPLPAVERYDGPYFRVLRRFLRETPYSQDHLKVLILSAEFGLIPSDWPIPNYDRRMTPSRTEELRPQVLKTLRSELADGHFTELFILLGADYQKAVRGFEAVVPTKTKIIQAKGAQGIKAGQLKHWLYGTTFDVALSKRKDTSSRSPRGYAIIRGHFLTLSPAQIFRQARESLRADHGVPDNFRDWYVLVDGRKVGPKWIVSQITGLAVNDFISSEARRVLVELGIKVHHI